MPYRIAIFDFDGTLMDTTSAITETVMRTMDALGVARPSTQAVTEKIGLALPVALSKLAGPGFDADHLCDTYRDDFLGVRTRTHVALRRRA